jgi:topoisomerase-4 subunit A
VITQIPFSTNTTTLIDSILKANEKVKSKSRKLKIIPLLRLRDINSSFPGVSPDKTIDCLLLRLVKLVAPLGCVIEDNKPFFIGFLKC